MNGTMVYNIKQYELNSNKFLVKTVQNYINQKKKSVLVKMKGAK